MKERKLQRYYFGDINVRIIVWKATQVEYVAVLPDCEWPKSGNRGRLDEKIDLGMGRRIKRVSDREI